MFTAQQVESITQEVLRELRSLGLLESCAADNERSGASPLTRQPASTKSDSVALSSQVVTEDVLAGANAAGRTIQLVTGAVITPSGNDYIRRHHVNVVFENAQQDKATGTLICTRDHSALMAAARTAGWQIQTAGCESDAARQASDKLPRSSVCSVAQPSVCACLLNRNPAVRAAVITPQTDLNALGTRMNPHVVCMTDQGWTFARLLQLFRRLSQQGAAAPPGWKELP